MNIATPTLININERVNFKRRMSKKEKIQVSCAIQVPQQTFDSTPIQVGARIN